MAEDFDINKSFVDNCSKTLDDQSKRLDKIDMCVFRLTTLVEQHEKQEKDHEERLRAIEKKGSDAMGKLVWLIVGAIVAGIMGFLLTQVGLK